MSHQEIRAHFLPQLVTADELAGGTTVVIDVLRATTTITAALAAGARDIIPCLEVQDAQRVAAGLPAGQPLLGGERGGVKIEGFDLGNSPSEYTPARVGGRTVVFTTTNGTRAMLHAQAADEIFLGALNNQQAVAQKCADRPRIDLLCSGTRGQITREDVLAAGAITATLFFLTPAGQSGPVLNDQARIARDVWLDVFEPDRDPSVLLSQLRLTQGGRNVIALGLEADLPDAAALDRFSLVPRFDPKSGRIMGA